MDSGQGPESYQERFLRLLQEADTIDLLRWSRRAVDEQTQRFCATRAHCLARGDHVEVTEGPARGRHGTILGHGAYGENLLLVQLEDVDVEEPLPIPATALRLLAA